MNLPALHIGQTVTTARVRTIIGWSEPVPVKWVGTHGPAWVNAVKEAGVVA